MANFGVTTRLRIVGSPASVLDAECRKMAVHAGATLDHASFHPNLESLFAEYAGKKIWRVAATARIASASRPHPGRVDEAMPVLAEKAAAREIEELFFVFGCESDGLSNEEVAVCDQVVTIPSVAEYRSLNLSQAVLVFLYEWNRARLTETRVLGTSKSQKQKLITHFLKLAEEVGFVLPGDPFKMRPRLEKILSALPPYLPEVKTLHGLLDQVSRSLKKGGPDIKGRYRRHWENRPERLS
jgi:tRNA/rRNA methyltransferase